MRSVSLYARPTIRLTLATALALLTPLVVAPHTAADPVTVTTEPSTLQCASSAPIYSVRANGDLWLYQHQEPETGLFSWATARPIDTRWLGAKSFAGPNGVIYSAVDNGNLLRRRWNGTGWDTFAGGAQFEVIDTGWARYTTPGFRNKIAADTEGHIYTIEPDNYLHWRSYNPTTRTWAHRIVSRPNVGIPSLVASGSGIVYVNGFLPRPPDNSHSSLERYRYHAGSQRLIQTNRYSFDGKGWGEFKQAFSAGGDIVYGVRSDNGDLMWLRFNEDTDSWADGGPLPGKRLDGGWQNEFDVFAAPDSCQRVGGSTPSRPQIAAQPHAPVTLLRSSNGHVHYSYVDSEGRAVYAEAEDLTGGSPIGAAVVPGFNGVTGMTSTAENENGRIQIVARGLDAEVRGNTRTAVSGPWEGTTTLGGFVSSPATSFSTTDKIGIFATDQSRGLWHRGQFEPNGSTQAWRRLGDSPLATGPITVVTRPNIANVRIIGPDRDGSFSIADASVPGSSFVGPWASLGGSGFRGGVSAVVMPDGKLQVFATDTDGVVRTQRETSTGFPGTWTTIPGVAASGAPSAVMGPDGRLQVVVRATDGYVYFTGQAAPGSGGFEPWREITNFSERSSTDPTALAVPEANTWVVAYRNEIDAPKLRRYQPGTSLADATPFVEIPMTPPTP